MTISEEARYRLHQRLEEVLGAEEAATLMGELPPLGWADLATKRDVEGLARSIEALAAATRRDIEVLAATTQAGFARAGGEFATVRAEFRTEFADIRERLERELRLQTWRVVMALVAVMSVFVLAVRV
jgi:hypothetical protein